MPTPTLEEYLEVIYKLSAEGVVRPTRVAEVIGVSGPTVTATLKRLESRGLVAREGTDVVLTSEGLTQSVAIVRKHRLAETFLVDVLGMDWEDAHDDACLLEHALSTRVLEALERFMDNPEVCPHGHPIPSAEGTMPALVAGRSLSIVAAGDSATVLRVSEDDAILGYLGELGLRPGARVKVVSVEPHRGPITVDVGGVQRAIAADVADRVTVA